MSLGVALISAVVGLVTLVFAIFGASWLNQRATEALIEQLERRFDALVSEFRSEIKHLDQRLDSVGERQLEAIFKPELPPRQGSG